MKGFDLILFYEILYLKKNGMTFDSQGERRRTSKQMKWQLEDGMLFYKPWICVS